MDDFWGPFAFGMSWLVLALACLWLLTRPLSRWLSLRSRAARTLAWILLALALAVFVTGLPFSLGFCRGGFDDPLSCALLPSTFVEALSPLSLLLALAGLAGAPVLAGGIVVLELLKRR